MVACSHNAKLEALLLAKGSKWKKYCIHPCSWVLFSELFKDCDWFCHRAILRHLTVTCCFLERPFIQEGAVELKVPQCTQCLGTWRLPRQRRQQRRATFSSAPRHAFHGALQTIWKGLWYEAVDPVISILLTACGAVANVSSHRREPLCVGRRVPGGCAGSPEEGVRAWQRSVSLDSFNLLSKCDVSQGSRKARGQK